MVLEFTEGIIVAAPEIKDALSTKVVNHLGGKTDQTEVLLGAAANEYIAKSDARSEKTHQKKATWADKRRAKLQKKLRKAKSKKDAKYYKKMLKQHDKRYGKPSKVERKLAKSRAKLASKTGKV